ncbi:MAG TPA: ABC transporter substrate-binding protein [Acidimicrobiales bacterium]|jgi:ABC-type branched-subunit amino acid transport system substrate-binding protein
MRRRITGLATTALAGATLAGLVTLGGTAGLAGAAASTAPGVTATSITVGSISTQTGPISSNFRSLIYGERAYFDYINAKGGINGRKIAYKYALDDGGSGSTFNQLAGTLINQDHVFAITGVATAFFSPNIVAEAKVPTYGYNVTENWAGPSNLFAAGGSVIYLPPEAAETAYVMNKTKSKSIAIVAYGIASSNAACAAAAFGLTAAGYKVSYTDLNINYPGTTVATDVQRMKQAGSDSVLTCMDVQGNITMARAIKQDGLKINQFWLNGNDQQTLNQNQSLMQGVYFYVSHVPFTEPASKYPALKLYLAQMKKYEPQYEFDEVAMQGWESAALFAQGVQLAGNNLTQANVIAQTNKLTAFTASGLIPPVNWAKGGHSGHVPPYCAAYIVVKGDKYVPAANLVPSNKAFVCFSGNAKNPVPIAPAPGTPAPS